MARHNNDNNAHDVDTGKLDLANVVDVSGGCWFYYENSAGTDERTLISNWSSVASQAIILFRIDPAGDRLELLCEMNDGRKTVTATDITLNLNQWYFGGFRIEGSGTVNVFVDETKSTQSTSAGTDMEGTNSNSNCELLNTPHANDPMAGRMAEAFVLVEELLTDDEFKALAKGRMDVLRGKFGHAESRYLPLYGNTSPEPDLSGNGHNGTVTGVTKTNHAPVIPYSATSWKSSFVDVVGGGLSAVGRTFNVRHDISEQVNRTFNIRHDLAGVVGRTFSLRHDILSIIGRTFNVRSDILNLVGRTFDLRHDIAEFVGRTFNLRHDLAGIVGRAFNLRHDLAGSVGRDFNIRHDVLQLVNRTFNLRHDVLNLVGRSFDLRHDISQFVGRVFNIRHDLAGAIGRTFNVRYDILGTAITIIRGGSNVIIPKRGQDVEIT